MKTHRYAFPIVAILYTAVYWVFAGPGPHGWSQPTKPTFVGATNVLNPPELEAWMDKDGYWNFEKLSHSLIDIAKTETPKEYPILALLRTYPKTNVNHAWIGGPPVFFDDNGVGTQNAIAIYHPATTNLVTVHVLGYFDGTNAVELLEVEKPQTK